MDLLNGSLLPAVPIAETCVRFQWKRLLVVVSGHYYWLEPVHAFETFREYEVGLIALSVLQGSFAYGGWNFLNYVTEELVDPCR